MSFIALSRPRWSRPLAGACCVSLAALTLSGAGCATTTYAPEIVARGEITLRYQQRRLELVAGGRPLSHGLLYNGLPEYVRCVPEAAHHARAAKESGRGAVALSILGAVFGVSTLVGFYGFYDKENLVPWLLGGVGLGVIGTTLAGLSHRFKNHANGHALDAVNYYNDAVGSLGATCDDLRYPEPAGPPAVPSLPPGSIDAPPLPPPPVVPAPATPQ